MSVAHDDDFLRRQPAKLQPPTPQPLPAELHGLRAAHAMGYACRERGFHHVPTPLEITASLRDWAWDLGWREAEWLAGRKRA
jgi:hypothetical protein